MVIKISRKENFYQFKSIHTADELYDRQSMIDSKTDPSFIYNIYIYIYVQ